MLMFVATTGSVVAQEMPMAKKLMQEEVPVSIVRSLQSDLNISEKGKWRVHYEQNVETLAYTVRLYVFKTKNEGKKIQVFYYPDGTVDHAKGVTVPETLARRK